MNSDNSNKNTIMYSIKYTIAHTICSESVSGDSIFVMVSSNNGIAPYVIIPNIPPTVTTANPTKKADTSPCVEFIK